MLLAVGLSAVLAVTFVSAGNATSDRSSTKPVVVMRSLVQVSIQANGKPVGVGVIIDPQFVLTTWTVIKDKAEDEIKVVSVDVASTIRNIHNVKTIASTSDDPYNPYEIKNLPNGGSRPSHDIALIQIDGSFNLGPASHLASASIANITFQPSLDATPDIQGFNDQLRPSVALLPYIKDENCTDVYKDHGGIFDGEICAGGIDTYPEGATLCPGDEGTPLLAMGNLIGIASWITGCDKPELPAVFTDIRVFNDWIRGSMAEMLGTEDEWLKPASDYDDFKKWLIRSIFSDSPACGIW